MNLQNIEMHELLELFNFAIAEQQRQKEISVKSTVAVLRDPDFLARLAKFHENASGLAAIPAPELAAAVKVYLALHWDPECKSIYQLLGEVMERTT